MLPNGAVQIPRTIPNRPSIGLVKCWAAVCALLVSMTAGFTEQAPILTLAMTGTPLWPQMSRGSDLSAFASAQSLFMHRENDAMTDRLRADANPAGDFSMIACIGKPGAVEHLPLTTRRNLREYGHAHVWATISAGYGQLVYDKPSFIYRPYDGWSQPGCGYLKITFSF